MGCFLPSGIRVAWPGFCASFVGVGLGRFAYTAIVPFLVSSGLLSVSEAGYVGAANLAGYFIGAIWAHRLGHKMGPVPAIKSALLLSVLSFAACADPAGFWWLTGWRFLAGVTRS